MIMINIYKKILDKLSKKKIYNFSLRLINQVNNPSINLFQKNIKRQKVKNVIINPPYRYLSLAKK